MKSCYHYVCQSANTVIAVQHPVWSLPSETRKKAATSVGAHDRRADRTAPVPAATNNDDSKSGDAQ